MTRDPRGQAFVSGFFLVLLLAAVAAGLADYYRLQVVRDAMERAAYEAALRGASKGRDWAYAAANGAIRLDAGLAAQAASDYLTGALAGAGVNAYGVDIRVLPDSGGGTIANYPPVARAAAFDSADWTSPRPAVGVYVEAVMPTMLLGLVAGRTDATLHAFGAAEVQGP